MNQLYIEEQQINPDLSMCWLLVPQTYERKLKLMKKVTLIDAPMLCGVEECINPDHTTNDGPKQTGYVTFVKESRA